MSGEILLNASDLGIYSRQGSELPQITATIRDLGTGEAMYFAFLIWAFAVVLHELAHWIYLMRFNKEAKITIVRKGIGIQLMTGEETDYEKLTKDEKITLYLCGIGAGLVPIILAGFIHPIYLLVLPAYITGCVPDFKLIISNIKEQMKK